MVLWRAWLASRHRRWGPAALLRRPQARRRRPTVSPATVREGGADRGGFSPSLLGCWSRLGAWPEAWMKTRVVLCFAHGGDRGWWRWWGYVGAWQWGTRPGVGGCPVAQERGSGGVQWESEAAGFVWVESHDYYGDNGSFKVALLRGKAWLQECSLGSTGICCGKRCWRGHYL